MHIKILVEDSSGKTLLEHLIPQMLGQWGTSHTWDIHPYKGIGRIPAGMTPNGDPAKRILLDQLPRVLQGLGKTPGIDAVLVVLDTDKRDYKTFLQELQSLARACNPAPNTLFRLAIEEIEAWYLGDRSALLAAYPNAKKNILDNYVQDSPCGTWELLADAIYPGGANAIKKKGWPLPGQVKHEWAGKIGPLMNIEKNTSPSFVKLRDGLRRIVREYS